MLPDYGYVLYAKYNDGSTSLHMWGEEDGPLKEAVPRLKALMEADGAEDFELRVVPRQTLLIFAQEHGYEVNQSG